VPDPIPLPGGIPDSLTLAQLRESIRAFGYQLVMTPVDAPKQPPGFAVSAEPARRDGQPTYHLNN